MKKSVFITLAAAAALLFASCTSESSCTYIIGHYVKAKSASGNPFSEAAEIVENFTDEIIALDKAHESDWTWTVTVKNDKYQNSDEEAIARFEAAVAEVDAINKKYIDKFKSCTAGDYSFSETHWVELKRVSSIDKDLGYKEFSISYGK